MPSKKQANGRVSPADWAAARDEYVTGDKSLAQIANDLGVTLNAVKKHACDRAQNGDRTWAEWREEFHAEISGQKTEVVKRIKVDAAAKVSMRHAEMLAELANQARTAIADALDACEPKDKVKLALAIIATERRVHGLDRAPVQVEVTGKDGGAIEHDIEHDLDDGVRAVAERALEALFGQTQSAHQG